MGQNKKKKERQNLGIKDLVGFWNILFLKKKKTALWRYNSTI
jgi:hypothetical protein